MIRSARLDITVPKPSAARAVADYYRVNLEHLRPWTPGNIDMLTDPVFWEGQLARNLDHAQTGLGYRFFIWPLDNPTLIIGNVGLTSIERGPAQTCNLGYGLSAAQEGKGYMTEAVTAVVEFAFNQLRLHRVCADYIPHNRRSGGVLRRAGFDICGYAREMLLINGRWEDHILTQRINPEWTAVPA